MSVSSSKENVLKKIREALSSATPLPFPQSEGNNSVYQPSQQELELEFAEQFTRLQGKFIYCLNSSELVMQLSQLAGKLEWKNIYCPDNAVRSMLEQNGFALAGYNDLASCDVSITGCECLVARTGTMVLSAAQPEGRTASVYAPIHVCIAYTDQLKYDIRDALQLLKEKYGSNLPSMISFATGPSRTADIEKTLVVGVHGPKEAYCMLLESR